jgi:hypothetical protein
LICSIRRNGRRFGRVIALFVGVARSQDADVIKTHLPKGKWQAAPRHQWQRSLSVTLTSRMAQHQEKEGSVMEMAMFISMMLFTGLCTLVLVVAMFNISSKKEGEDPLREDDHKDSLQG